MKSKLAAYLLWGFLGFFSMHRFYLGKVGSGVLYFFTGQLLGIGWIIDLFILGNMVDNYNNKIAWQCRSSEPIIIKEIIR